jgi:uncharacterized protein with HEPN domain
LNDPRRRLDDILPRCDDAAQLDVRGRDAFETDVILRHAAKSIIADIGEAAKKLEDLADQVPGVPWAQIARMRDRVAHRYFDVDYDVVWRRSSATRRSPGHLSVRLAEIGGVTAMTFVHTLAGDVDVTDVGPGWEFYADRLTASRNGVKMPDWDADGYQEALAPPLRLPVADTGPMNAHDHGNGPPHDKASWDDRYRSSQRVWSRNPNPQLVTEIADLAPGRALDVGCGEGADAIWLARRGWDVVACDLSAVALERGAQHARETDPGAAARIDWQEADLLASPPAPDSFDLVTAQFM